MILIDANILIYAHHAGLPEHQRSKEWLEQILTSGEPVGFAVGHSARVYTSHHEP